MRVYLLTYDDAVARCSDTLGIYESFDSAMDAARNLAIDCCHMGVNDQIPKEYIVTAYKLNVAARFC